MYISMMFMTYIAASFVALLGLGMALLIISKSKDFKSPRYRVNMSFGVTVVAVSILYFFMYFRDVVFKDYDVALFVRVIDYFLYGAVFFFWLRTIHSMGTEKKHTLAILSWIVGITIASVGMIGTAFFMDDTYSFNDLDTARVYTIIEILISVFAVSVIGKYSFDFVRIAVSKGKRIYVALVSSALIVWSVQQIFVDYNLYFGQYESAWSNEILDTTSITMIIVGLANFIYIFREDFSPQYYVKAQEISEEIQLDPIQLAAVQHHLTVREEEVLRLAYEGKNNPEIAEQLFISVNTVKKHMKNIYEKLGVSTRMELVFIINKGKTLDITE